MYRAQACGRCPVTIIAPCFLFIPPGNSANSSLVHPAREKGNAVRMEPVPSSFSLLHLASVHYRGTGKQKQMGDCPQGGMEMGERGLIPQGVGLRVSTQSCEKRTRWWLGTGRGRGTPQTHSAERESHCHLCV